ncbi:hypothetical protein TELCIR_10439 [Teladorsagia circumcincta]|uniref:GSKIP domain-containing protein n=1 Tax=Teladorsagia circumcincta TaxID=45464 RepID=A0A2G9UC54_TELCI|nr:hypothetical protein TELCIR_10439 [Teladorsagia circumcincta]
MQLVSLHQKAAILYKVRTSHFSKNDLSCLVTSRPRTIRHRESLGESTATRHEFHAQELSSQDTAIAGGHCQHEQAASHSGAVLRITRLLAPAGFSLKCMGTAGIFELFLNFRGLGQPYTLELTLKGWRIASSHTDCMNGDYTKVSFWRWHQVPVRVMLNIGGKCPLLLPVHIHTPDPCAQEFGHDSSINQASWDLAYLLVDLHTRYFRNARELLSFISPDHATRFNECLANKLNELAVNVRSSFDS